MTDRKSYVGLSKNPFLDLYDDLSDLALCPTETPVKQIHPPLLVKFMLAAGAYSWRP